MVETYRMCFHLFSVDTRRDIRRYRSIEKLPICSVCTKVQVEVAEEQLGETATDRPRKTIFLQELVVELLLQDSFH